MTEEKKMSEISAEAVDAEELEDVSGGLKPKKRRRRRKMRLVGPSGIAAPALKNSIADDDDDDDEDEDGEPEFEPGPSKFIKVDL